MAKLDPKTGIWSRGEGMGRLTKGSNLCDYTLAGALRKWIAYTSACDLGCSSGIWCKTMRGLGWDIVGYDGTEWEKGDNVFHNIKKVDLSQRHAPDRSYDFVLCLEVGEHIPKDREQVFLDNIAEYCNLGGVMVLSWAIPGQGGTGHFNERTNEYVIDQMQDRGFGYNDKYSMWLRKFASVKWFENTVMVFKK